MKFTPKGGRIQVLLQRIDSHVEVSIVDTGEGISSEFLPHVFNRFQQGDASTTRRHGGLGLGLAIVKQLVELHGGTVRVKSDGPGKGATFTVSLPMAAIHFPPDQERRSQPSKPKELPFLPEISLSGIRVFVIDDEADSRDLIKKLLEFAGATVYLADQFLPRRKAETLVAALSMPTIAESEHARSETFDGPESVYRVCADLKLFNQEVLRVLLLDTRQRLITTIDVTKGGLNESLAYPSDIFRPVIVHSAYSFILAHNHPSGDPSPSEADLRLTRRLNEAARILQIQMLDHVIIGEPMNGRQGYFSFKEAGTIG